MGGARPHAKESSRRAAWRRQYLRLYKVMNQRKSNEEFHGSSTAYVIFSQENTLCLKMLEMNSMNEMNQGRK